jgi:hypothetical protein
VTLLGLLGRSLAVALLFGVLLLPAADHHLASRLPGAHDLDAEHQVMHHHGADASRERGDGAPLLLPLGASGVGVAAPIPIVDLPPAAARPLLGRSMPVEPSGGVPPPLLEPPPLPPPILPA